MDSLKVYYLSSSQIEKDEELMVETAKIFTNIIKKFKEKPDIEQSKFTLIIDFDLKEAVIRDATNSYMLQFRQKKRPLTLVEAITVLDSTIFNAERTKEFKEKIKD